MTTRLSITGLLFCLTGGAIAYKWKLQATGATSSTEAGFIGDGQAAKIAKDLRLILVDFWFPQSAPTPLYEDDLAAIV
jgi:hypothetical protein